MKKIAVVIPCFNEQAVLPIYYNEMKSLIEKMNYVDFELIFVDDGSDDQTLTILQQFHLENSQCRYLSFSRNFGKEAALYAGLKASTGDYTVIMDADLQDPPHLIEEMYRLLETSDYDCVATRRINRIGEGRLKSYLSDKFYSVINHISKVKIIPGARDYRMMKRNIVTSLLEISEVNRFSKGLLSWIGFKTYWLEYDNVERVAGDTKWSFKSLIKYSIDGILGFSTLPLSIASYGGILFCGLSFLLVVLLIIKNLFWHDSVAGWSAMICSIFFIGGVQLLCLGVLGQYLARTYIEVKNRPIYILKENSNETKE